jgi:hypothetical protein
MTVRPVGEKPGFSTSQNLMAPNENCQSNELQNRNGEEIPSKYVLNIHPDHLNILESRRYEVEKLIGCTIISFKNLLIGESVYHMLRDSKRHQRQI